MFAKTFLIIVIALFIAYNSYTKNYFTVCAYILFFSPLFWKYVSEIIDYFKKILQLNRLKQKINETILFKDILNIEPDISNECNICLEDFQITEPVVLLPCGCLQLYHEQCILEWIAKNPSCPTCRKELS